MDLEDLREKMDPQHAAFLRQMLGVKELPENLLRLYIKVKTMTDKVDGFLGVGELALIAIMSGETQTPAEILTGQKTSEVSTQPASQPAQTVDPSTVKKVETTPWTLGMPVNVFHDDELKPGKIVDIKQPEPPDDVVKFTIQFDDSDETIAVEEMELDLQ